MEETKKYYPCKPRIDDETFEKLLESIAKEEFALGHILWHEGDKIEAVVDKFKCHKYGHHVKLEDLLATNESVRKMIIAAIKKEMLLEFKLENVIELFKLNERHHY